MWSNWRRGGFGLSFRSRASARSSERVGRAIGSDSTARSVSKIYHCLSRVSGVGMIRPAALLLGLAPIGVAAYKIGSGSLSPNPIEDMIRLTGFSTIAGLALTLSIRPIGFLSGSKIFGRAKRALGLWTFFYGSVHFMIFVSVDYGFNYAFLKEAALKKPYALVGLAALLMMTPRFITSFGRFRKFYATRRRYFDLMVYASAILAALHYHWLTKADLSWPIFFYAFFLILFAIRIVESSGAEILSKIKSAAWRKNDR